MELSDILMIFVHLMMENKFKSHTKILTQGTGSKV